MSYFEPKTCNTCNRNFVTESHFFQNTSRWRICSRKNLWFNCSCDSTLLIPKGKFEWYSPKKHMRGDLISIFNQLGSEVKIPYIDNSVATIQIMISAKDPLDKIYLEIKKDALLSAQIIEIMRKIQIASNSGTKAGPALKYAVSYLGHDRLSEIILPAFLATISVNCSDFDIKAFWKKSYQVAMIAVLLNSFSKINLHNDLVFISASLCNIGVLANAIYFPEKIDTLWKKIIDPKSQDTWENHEKKLNIYSSSVMGEIAGSLWGFSDSVLEVVRYHREIEIPKNVNYQDLVLLISLSEMATSWITSEPHLINDGLLNDRLHYFDMDESKLECFTNLNLNLAS